MMKQIKVELQETMGSDRSIADAAWTSSLDYQKKKTRSTEDVARIVNMLADSKHSTPFESVVFRFWIKMPIQTDRQFMTHRIQSASGMSGRYRTMPDEYLKTPDDVKTILSKTVPIYEDLGLNENNIIEEYNDWCTVTNKFYNNLIDSLKKAEKEQLIDNKEYKRCREFFRGVLPQNNMTERVSIMNLRAFANFIKLRLSKDAQPEIQEVARQMIKAVEDSGVCPLAIEALKRNNWMI